MSHSTGQRLALYVATENLGQMVIAPSYHNANSKLTPSILDMSKVFPGESMIRSEKAKRRNANRLLGGRPGQIDMDPSGVIYRKKDGQGS